MKKLKIVLHSKWFYCLLITVTLIYSFIYLMIPRNSKLDINDTSFKGVITNIKIVGDLLSIEIDGVEKLIGNYYFKTEEEKNLFSKNYQLGDKVLLRGKLKVPSNNTVPNSFNYRKYLERKGIYYLINVDEIEKRKDNKNLFYSLKNIMIKHIDRYNSKDYLHTFILGNNDYLDNDILTIYQENGISHLLAISGMHVSLLSAMVLFVLKKLNVSILKRYLFTIVFLFFFMFLSGCSASVSRSVLLFSFLSLNKFLKLDIKTINIFLIVFSLLIFINPYFLFDVGFQFSFIVSFYLILVSDRLKNYSYIYSLLNVSIISFLVSLPISIYYFYQINLLSIIFNLVFVPLVSFIIFPLSIITFILPFLDSIFMFFIGIIEWLSIWCNEIEVFKIILGKPSLIWIILYYLVITFILYKDNKKFLILIVLLILFQYYSNLILPSSFVMMIDVGQGDSLFIHDNNKTVLIDTGGKISYTKESWQKRKIKGLAESTLIPLLKSISIKKIDYLILTHGDYDHMGEAINLVENFKVEKVIFNCGELNKLEQDLIEVLDKKKISYYSCIKELNIDDNKLYFLNNKDYGNENDNSSVIYTELNNHKFLFMGDAGIKVEEDLIEKYNIQDIDVLKVGHHGSKTSSGEKFINEINPKYSVISVGKNNRYGHPNDKVLDNLEDSKVYRTDQDGSIMFEIKNNKLRIEMCSP